MKQTSSVSGRRSLCRERQDGRCSRGWEQAAKITNIWGRKMDPPEDLGTKDFPLSLRPDSGQGLKKRKGLLGGRSCSHTSNARAWVSVSVLPGVPWAAPDCLSGDILGSPARGSSADPCAQGGGVLTPTWGLHRPSAAAGGPVKGGRVWGGRVHPVGGPRAETLPAPVNCLQQGTRWGQG